LPPKDIRREWSVQTVVQTFWHSRSFPVLCSPRPDRSADSQVKLDLLYESRHRVIDQVNACKIVKYLAKFAVCKDYFTFRTRFSKISTSTFHSFMKSNDLRHLASLCPVE
jgi:hypothetical protein